jgi:hypothetical protein
MDIDGDVVFEAIEETGTGWIAYDDLSIIPSPEERRAIDSDGDGLLR